MIARPDLPLARFAFRLGLAPAALASGELRGIAARPAHGDFP
jgi:hypothetical protein